MAIDYNTIKYMETVGGMLRVHYKDGQKVDSYPVGKGRFLPRKGPIPPPPPPPEDETPPDPPTDPNPGSWQHPAPGTILTSPFGPRSFDFHYGIDLSSTTAPVGVPILAVCDTIITVAWDAYEGGNSTAGTYVKGHSPDGAYTFTYNHGADGSLRVAAGQTVPKGTQLFLEGATGNVFGTHLHFEIIEGVWNDPWAPPYNYGANFVDPIPVLAAHGVNI